VRDRQAIEAIIHGGGQQFGIRPGTENVPGIVGLGAAVGLAAREQMAEASRLRALRDELERRVLALVPDAVINGWQTERAPHVSRRQDGTLPEPAACKRDVVQRGGVEPWLNAFWSLCLGASTVRSRQPSWWSVATTSSARR